MGEEEAKKISKDEFVIRAIKKLKRPPYRGIHSVYSGFNQAFREYFSSNPIEVTNRLAQEGKIRTRPVKGGVMLYLPEDIGNETQSVLKKILSED